MTEIKRKLLKMYEKYRLNRRIAIDKENKRIKLIRSNRYAFFKRKPVALKYQYKYEGTDKGNSEVKTYKMSSEELENYLKSRYGSTYKL